MIKPVRKVCFLEDPISSTINASTTLTALSLSTKSKTGGLLWSTLHVKAMHESAALCHVLFLSVGLTWWNWSITMFIATVH